MTSPLENLAGAFVLALALNWKQAPNYPHDEHDDCSPEQQHHDSAEQSHPESQAAESTVSHHCRILLSI